MNCFSLTLRVAAGVCAMTAWSLVAAPIPGLFNTGVAANNSLLAGGAIDPHYRLIQSADAAAPGPNAFVVNEGFPIGTWLNSGPNSKWIAPMAAQGTGNLPGDYKYRLVFDLTGLEPATAVITGRWSSDNGGSGILLNGQPTGITYSGDFTVLSAVFTINSGFIDGTNTLDFVVNNAGTGANPTGFRAELSGTAEVLPPPGTPPSITSQPASQSVGIGDSVSFRAGAAGARPLSYQWRFNGANIPDATNNVFALACVSGAAMGGYDMVASNPWGSATSTVAVLTVVNLSPAQLSYEPAGPSSRRSGITFSEIMYHPTNRTDGLETEFVELYNSNPFFEDIGGWRITGEWDYTFSSNTLIQGNSFLVIAPVPAGVQTVYGINGVLGGFTNRLNNSSGTLRLRKRSGGVVLDMTYSDQPPWPVAADGTGHSLVLARASYGENDPRAWAASAFKGGSPGAADPVPTGDLENVVINEVLAHTDLPQLDFIELHNHSLFPADLSGCWLSDDPATNKFRIPDGVTLDPRGFMAFDQNELGFALQADGETIYLVNSNRTRVIDAVRFDGQANGVSYGRSPDGGPTFQELSAPTRGTTNAPALLRDIAINEIMYHPLSGDSDEEYVELFNRGGSPVNIGGWRFIAGIDYTLPLGTTMQPGSYLVVAANTARLMSNYPALPPVSIVGNFSGKLADGGERVALAMPDFAFTTNGNVITTNRFYIVVDEVTYGDGGRWGRWSDGGGSSLELIDAHSDNRLAANWADSDSTTNAGWTIVENTGVLDLGSGAADKLDVILMGEGEVLVDDVEVIPAGGANRVTNPGFESGVSGWIFEGNHVKSGPETSSGYNSARSLHLRASDRGDLAANHARTTLSAALAAGSTATIRAKVRWLRGHPEILFRLKGNWLEAFGRLAVPANLGTPGAANSQAAANTGPAITEVTHRPVLPAAFESIRVTARVQDPDGVQNVTLQYRIDPSATLLSVPMTDDGLGCDALAGDGIFTAVIPGQATDKLIAFRVQATDRFAPAATTQFPNDAPARECLVRVGETQPAGAFGAYHLWLTAASVTTWAGREKLSNESLDGTFVYGRNRVVYNVGAHYAGSSYTSPGYTSPIGALCGYDIFFPADEPFLGETHTVLDWPVRDTTDQREQMMFWLLDQYGLPNMYRRYVIMFVNGIRRGEIYDDVQQPTGSTVEEWFPNDSGGTLLKTDCWDEFNDTGDRETSCIALNSLQTFTTTGGVKKPARYRWVWRPRAVHGTVNDFTDLYDLVDAANAPTNNYQAAMEGLADVEHWMRTFAANDLASYWDAFGNPNAKNTFLYKPESDRWKLMCWDFDVGLGASTVNAAAESPTAELFPLLGDPNMNRLYAFPPFLRLYWNAIDEAVNGFFQSGPGTKVDAILDAKYAAFQASGLNLVSPFVASGGNNISIPAWISQRRTFLITQLAAVNGSFALTTPATVVTNRNLITLGGTAPVRVRTLLVNGVPYPVTWTTVAAWRILVPVLSGPTNLVVTALDRFGNVIPGATATVAVTYTGADESPADTVVINEIMYNPVTPNASFVEIYNTSTNYSFDLSNWELNGVGYSFPPGTILTNGQFLVLAGNKTMFARTYGTNIPVAGEFSGQLDDGGETLTLSTGTNAGPALVVDRVSYDDDPPWPAGPDGHGTSLQVVDPKQDNSRVSNWGESTGWKFYSYTANAGSAATRFYLYLDGPGDVYIDSLSLVPGTVAGVGSNYLRNGNFESPLAGSWTAVGNHAGSATSSSVAVEGSGSLHLLSTGVGGPTASVYQDPVGIVSTNPYTISFWYLPSTNANGLFFRLSATFRNGTAINVRPVFHTAGTTNAVLVSLPPYAPLWLSEVEPLNLTGLADNFGDRDPWIEIHNSGVSLLNLDGYFLADNYSNLTQWPFPPGTVIDPGEFKIIWADGEPGETAGTNLHTVFRLAPSNGSVVLSRLANSMPQIVDYLNYRGVGADASYGSSPPGQASYRQTFSQVTPGGTNDPYAPLVTLFINEWMASNTSFMTDPNGGFDDWFEIYNPTSNRVDLAGYTLTDTFAIPAKFRIPAGYGIAAHGYLLVWADEQTGQSGTNGELHVNFKLSGSGEAIGLYDLAGRTVDAITFGAQTNNISQGRSPDGAAPPFRFMGMPTPRASNVIPTLNPRIIEISFNGNLVTITWLSEPGRSYRVQFKNDLGDPQWSNLDGPPVLANGATASAQDAVPGAQRFYRIMVEP